jgi:hypothetical protein
MTMSFGRRRGPLKGSQRAGVIAAAIAAAMAGSGIFTDRARGNHRIGGDLGSMNTLLIFCAAIALPVVVFLIVKMNRSGDDDESRRDEPDRDLMSAATDSSSTGEDDQDRKPLALIIGLVLAFIGIVVALMLRPADVHAQGAADRGALYLRQGTDTVVTDRFEWRGDTLRGRAQVKGQQAIAYVAVLGPGNELRTLSYDVFAPAAKDGDSPAMHLFFTMKGDTAIAETPAGVQRVPTKLGAIPMVGNALALTELFTRRAKAAGGTLEIPYLAVSGGATIMVGVKPAGADSLIVMVGAQEQRFHVDAIGRILGGTVTGRNFEFVRGGPAAAGTFHDARAAAPAAPPDYSAPSGAPYTAEEVKVRTPAGFDLGGTLTIPKNIRGRVPAVVTITGSGQQDRDEFIPLAGGVRLYRQLADTLSRRGIAVLRLDDRGLGASGGDPRLSTTVDFADDIRAGVAFLRSRADIDPDRIALVGHSEGGIIAPMIAATDPGIRAIVSFAGTAVKGIEISMAQNQYALEQNKSLSKTVRDSILRAAHASLAPENQTVPWLKFFMGYDPAPTLRQVKVATLVMQGATDRQVPVAQAELYAGFVRAGGNKDVTVRIFPATNHLFIPDSVGDPAKYDDLKSNRVRPEILGAVADWLALKLNGKQIDVRP